MPGTQEKGDSAPVRIPFVMESGRLQMLLQLVHQFDEGASVLHDVEMDTGSPFVEEVQGLVVGPINANLDAIGAGLGLQHPGGQLFRNFHEEIPRDGLNMFF